MFERGSIHYIYDYATTGCEIQGGRPAIIVSNDKNNRNSAVVEVVFLTTKPKKDLPTHILINSAYRPSTALCEQICSVSKDRIGNHIGNCTKDEMNLIDIALAISLDLNYGKSDTPKATTKQNPEATPHSVDSTNIVKLQAELDTYKSLYTHLLEKVLKGGKE